MTERPLFRERRKNQLLRGENSAASRDKCSFQSLLQDLPKALQEAVHDTVAACQPRYRPSLYANDWLEELYHEAACAACYALAKYDPSKGDLYAFGVLVIQLWVVGDATGNGIVTLADLDRVMADMDAQHLRSDLNEDGVVDWSDVDIVLANLGAGNSTCEGCTVQVEQAPEYLWHGEEFTFRARANVEGGTYSWRVVQQNRQLSPTSGTGSSFTVRANNPSHNQVDRVRILVEYSVPGRKPCRDVREIVVYPRPVEAYVVYRNEDEPDNAYPYHDQRVSIWAVIRASDGRYYTGASPNGTGFNTNATWWRTSTRYRQGGGEQGVSNEGVRWQQAPNVREWWGPNLDLRWYRLRHVVDRETSNTPFVSRSVDNDSYLRYYIYNFIPDSQMNGWGSSLTLERGTHRFVVRVHWRNGRIQSHGPTPGNRGGDWADWSQDCDESSALATRISVRQRRNDEDRNRRELIEWAMSFIGVAYEWGGHWYGGRADNQYEISNTDNELYNDYAGYGTDCSGLVSACAKLAGYNWNVPGYPYGGWRFAARHFYRCKLEVRGSTYTITEPVEPRDVQPGDLLIWVRVRRKRTTYPHVAIIYRIGRLVPHPMRNNELTSLRVSYIDSSPTHQGVGIHEQQELIEVTENAGRGRRPRLEDRTYRFRSDRALRAPIVNQSEGGN